MYAIKTENLTRDFKAVRAVDRLSLEVPAGSVFGFIGPNGAGKTTTIRLLLGLLEPTIGSAEVLGMDVSTQSDQVRRQCGALLEHSGLYERLSAEDNLEFYGRVWRIPVDERCARIKELLNHFGLWERRRELVGTWSRGMKQKLAVARTLLHRPTLVFMDEPTAGLDPVAAAALREDLAGLSMSDGATIFLTTHNLAEAEKLCHQVGVIHQGRLLAVGSLDALRGHSDAPRIEVIGSGFTDQVLSALKERVEVTGLSQENGRLILTLQPGVQTAPLITLMTGAGVQVEEVHKSKASLEEVFLTLLAEETNKNEE